MPISESAKDGAGKVAQKAQVAGKVAQAHVRKRSLKKELAAAESSLAQAVLGLAGQGKVDHPELQDHVRRANEAQAALREQEEEVARLRRMLTSSGEDQAWSGDQGDVV
jgi:hypothetical protein